MLGTATNAQLAGWTRGAPPAPTDPYWSSVVFLFNAADGTLKDRSSLNNSITVVQSPGGVPSTVQTKFNPYSIYTGPGAGNQGTRWRVTNNTALNCPGQFTLDFWIWGASAFTGNSCPMSPATDTGANLMIVGNRTDGERLKAEFTSSYNKYFISPGDSLNSQWHLGSITRDASNVIRFFYDGQLQPTTRTSSAQIDFFNWMFGGYLNMQSDNIFVGYMDDIRLTKGVCRYTTSYAMPTAAWPTS